jgi:hypothetical protein
MRRRAAILAVLALAAPACASSDRELHSALLAERLETMTIITRAEVNREPPGSPSRAVLRLWRAVQFRNPVDALAHVSPPPKPKELSNFEGFIVAQGAEAAATTKPRILDVKQSGSHAQVLVEFVRHRKVGDQVRSHVTGRLTAELVHGRTGWLVLWRKASDQLAEAIS